MTLAEFADAVGQPALTVASSASKKVGDSLVKAYSPFILPEDLSLDSKNMLLKSESWALEQYGASGKNPGGPVASRQGQGQESDLCRPHDRSMYQQRVSTFKLSWWFAKPNCLSPLVCARFGWCNSGPDMLKCNSCGRFISFKISQGDKLGTDKFDGVTKNQLGLLSSGHAGNCAWVDNASHQSFSNIPSSIGELIQEHRGRLSSFTNAWDSVLHKLEPNIAFADSLVKFSDVEMLPAPTQVLSTLKSSVSNVEPLSLRRVMDALLLGSEGESTEDENEAQRVKKSADRVRLSLSLFGWESGSVLHRTGNLNQRAVLSCSFCQRKVGLWNFLPPERMPDDDVSSSPERPSKRARLAGRFNVIQEHHWFCPYRCTASVNAKGGRAECPGWWAVICAHSSGFGQPTPSPTKEQISKAREFLNMLSNT